MFRSGVCRRGRNTSLEPERTIHCIALRRRTLRIVPELTAWFLRHLDGHNFARNLGGFDRFRELTARAARPECLESTNLVGIEKARDPQQGRHHRDDRRSSHDDPNQRRHHRESLGNEESDYRGSDRTRETAIFVPDGVEALRERKRKTSLHRIRGTVGPRRADDPEARNQREIQADVQPGPDRGGDRIVGGV